MACQWSIGPRAISSVRLYEVRVRSEVVLSCIVLSRILRDLSVVEQHESDGSPPKNLFDVIATLVCLKMAKSS